MGQSNKHLHLTSPFGLNRPKATASMAPMRPLFRKLLRKYNGALAMMLSLALIVASSLNLIHDQLLDHDHDSECVMCVIDSKPTVLAKEPNCCELGVQQTEIQHFSVINLILSHLETHSPRGPPSAP